MAPIRPEFFYHPAVGVVSPASLGLFAFKSGSLNNPLPQFSKEVAPKPLVKVTSPAEETLVEKLVEKPVETTILSTTSPVALTPDINPEPVVKKITRDTPRNETCIVTGNELPYTQMIRFVIDPENNIVPDLTEKLPGKAFWMTATRDVLKKAIWRNSFTTAAREAVNVPQNLSEMLQIGLLKQSLETMGLARKAGLVTQGFAKVEEVLQAAKAQIYIVSSDAKENGREKLEKLTKGAQIVDIWTSSQLSAALGEDNAVHVALAPGGLTDKLLIIAQKLKDIR